MWMLENEIMHKQINLKTRIFWGSDMENRVDDALMFKLLI